MTHREVLEAMSGLLLGMFVAILSSTVVTTALPRIIGDLGGSQSSYTWVVTSTLLALTVTTPIWGKLADLFDRKLLVQTGPRALRRRLDPRRPLAVDVVADRAAASMQGIGVGGLTALVQVILADLVSPRERGRYAGYLGAVFGLGTVAGPLIGGVVTDGARLALVLLRRRAVRGRRVRRAAAHAAPAAPPPRGADRLPRRDADRRRRLEPADLGLARRPAVRLGLVADRRARRARRRAAASARSCVDAPRAASRSSRCGCSATARSCSP